MSGSNSTTSGGGSEVVVIPAAAGEDPTRSRAPVRPDHELRGMVVNADGLGLPGIEMWSGFGAVVAPPAEKGPEASAARRTVTGGDGGFTLGVDAKRHESPGTLLQAADPSGTYAPATALARGDAPVRFVLQPAARSRGARVRIAHTGERG
ncbi:MAG: hypothetical protein ACYTFT_05990 [Planctomycetota bacterium]